jgi:heptosyltransferase-1
MKRAAGSLSDLSGKRILIVKPSSLGDVVHTVPLVHSLKRNYPDCRIGWIIQKSFAPIVENDPSVDELIQISIPSTSDPGAKRRAYFRAAKATFSVLRDLRRRFSEEPYDYVLDLHASFRSGLLGLTNPGGIRIGFADAKELNTRFQNYLLKPHPDKPHAVDKNLLFAEFLGCDVEPDDFRLVSSPEAGKRVQEMLTEWGVKLPRKIIYANPASRWETKFWTISGWAKLADRIAEVPGWSLIFSGGPEDVEYIQRITAQMKTPAIVAAGRLKLSEAVALLQRSDLYVGVDSGPMHIAAFTDTPVVAIFGPTDPAKVGPYCAGHIILRNESLECLTCRKRSCEEMKCMTGVTAEMVFEAVREKLGKR